MAYENKNYRRAVAALPCVHCGCHGRSQAAHSNEYRHGKGRSLKASDAAIFPLCCAEFGRLGCHDNFDQHRLFSRADRAEGTDRFIALTIAALIGTGRLVFHGDGVQSWLFNASPREDLIADFRLYADEGIRLLESNLLRLTK